MLKVNTCIRRICCIHLQCSKQASNLYQAVARLLQYFPHTLANMHGNFDYKSESFLQEICSLKTCISTNIYRRDFSVSRHRPAYFHHCAPQLWLLQICASTAVQFLGVTGTLIHNIPFNYMSKLISYYECYSFFSDFATVQVYLDHDKDSYHILNDAISNSSVSPCSL